MKTIINHITDPYFNLALEEYLLKQSNIQEDIFYLWQNSPSVIIGRNQNPFLEVNQDYTSKNSIPIIRRISGGGAVYHDLGNINFTYIKTGIKKYLNNYRIFLNPLIDILNKIGVKAEFVEKCHIYIDEKKISGNAQSFYKDRVIHHGTLLYDTDLDILTEILKNKNKYTTHAIKSNLASTTNIAKHMIALSTVEELMDYILSNMFMDDYQNHIYILNDTEVEQILSLVEKKYKTWKWNFGETPDFEIEKKINDSLTITLEIKKGIITQVKTSNSNIDLKKCLEGIPLSENKIRAALSNCDSLDIDNFIKKILR